MEIVDSAAEQLAAHAQVVRAAGEMAAVIIRQATVAERPELVYVFNQELNPAGVMAVDTGTDPVNPDKRLGVHSGLTREQFLLQRDRRLNSIRSARARVIPRDRKSGEADKA